MAELPPSPPRRDRKSKLISVVLKPEDKEVVDWLDDKIYFGRRDGTLSPDMDRSRLIMTHLRALMEAERAALAVAPKPARSPARTPRKK